MSAKMKQAVGVVLVVVGVVLVTVFPDSRFFWFEGQPAGVVLVVLGVIEFAESFWRAKPRAAADESRGAGGDH
ncbi:hypothetical protein ACIQUQ_05600 [Streptomyces sp. NPDC101118]|uniref:hypothetical protein n=1 Tax=Streptomyces sp. NPDC101118 TaxID=3366109 RepID=UPI0037F5FAB3